MDSKYPESTRIQVQGNTFKAKRTDLKDLSPSGVYSFGYQAVYSGTRGKNMPMAPNTYDANPLVFFLRSEKDGLIGLNTHYLQVGFEKALAVMIWKQGQPFTRQMYDRMVHKYVFKRFLTPLYQVESLEVDKTIISSAAKWSTLTPLPQPRSIKAPRS